MGKGSLVSGPSPTVSKSERDYMAEDDHRTLSRAEEVRADASRMQAAGRFHAKEALKHKRLGRMFGRQPMRQPARAAR